MKFQSRRVGRKRNKLNKLALLGCFCLSICLIIWTIMDGELQHNKPLKVYEKVHIFYYPWYSNPTDSPEYGWNHWNHQILPHWDSTIREQHVHGIKYRPENEDIGSSYFPTRGLYSSAHSSLLDEHMKELVDYLVVVSWWGRDKADGEGMSTDKLFPLIFESAQKFDTKIAVHLEPYDGRTAMSVKEDINYLIETYGHFKSFYRTTDGLPIVYLYDSYLIPTEEWKQVLTLEGEATIRKTEHDALILGLYLNEESKKHILESGMNGFYTYFAAEHFTAGSTSSNWNSIVTWAKTNNLLCSISIGPGYDDTRIRPWNSQNKKTRDNGSYYDHQWTAAINSKPNFISITSYNEWMEGTQIESATSRSIPETVFDGKPYNYCNYSPLDDDYYIRKTKWWALKTFHSL